jgi:hypothetical protein
MAQCEQYCDECYFRPPDARIGCLVGNLQPPSPVLPSAKRVGFSRSFTETNECEAGAVGSPRNAIIRVSITCLGAVKLAFHASFVDQRPVLNSRIC